MELFSSVKFKLESRKPIFKRELNKLKSLRIDNSDMDRSYMSNRGGIYEDEEQALVPQSPPVYVRMQCK